MRKTISALALAAAAAGVIAGAAAPVASADELNACQLSGNASFDSPLQGTSSIDTHYSFTGTLSNCQSSVAGAPTGGTIVAGTDGLPKPSLSGDCASSTTSGISVVQWNDGKTTVVSYSTKGAAAAVGLTGNVIQSVQAFVGYDVNGNPIYKTYTTNEPATPVGDYSGGALAFQPPDPTACGPNGAGVSTAGISGAIGTGNESEVPPPAAGAKAHKARHATRARARARRA